MHAIQNFSTQSFCLVTKSRRTLYNPLHCLPGSSVRGVFQVRILEWVAFSFSIHLMFSSADFLLTEKVRLVWKMFPRIGKNVTKVFSAASWNLFEFNFSPSGLHSIF